MDISRDRHFLLLLGSVLVLSLIVVTFSGSLKREQKEEATQDITAELEGVVSLKEGDETGRSVTYSAGGLFTGIRGETGVFDLGGEASGYAILQVGKWDGQALVLADSEGEQILTTTVDANTSLWVEDLRVSPFKDVLSNITIFSALDLQERATQGLIGEGDILAVIYPLEEGLTSESILALVLRRYGGLEQLQGETSITLSAPR